MAMIMTATPITTLILEGAFGAAAEMGMSLDLLLLDAVGAAVSEIWDS